MAIVTEHQRHHRTNLPGAAQPHALEPERRSGARTWLMLGVFLVGTQAAGLVGLPFTDRVPGGWYDQLDKPFYNPPGWVFGPVWTLLYSVIAVAAWLVWRHVDSPARQRALALFAVQLVLNALWAPLFFGAQWIDVALVEVLLLWVAAAATLAAFFRVDRTAGLLFVPYVGWVTFAVALNAGIAVLN